MAQASCELTELNLPLYDYHSCLNFVFLAIGTSWLNTDEETCLDEIVIAVTLKGNKKSSFELLLNKTILSNFEIRWNSSACQKDTFTF